METFMGYRRPDGQAGVRNYVAVLSTVSCGNGVISAVCNEVAGTVPLIHGHGCGRFGQDVKDQTQVFINMGRHPNVAAMLVIGLGCEVIQAKTIADGVRAAGKPVEYFTIQEVGGTRKSVEKGVEIARRMVAEADRVKREPVPVSELTLGLQCGGSDAFSGLTANGAVGKCSDWLVEQGGTVILTENTEMIGTSHILQKRAKSPEVAKDIKEMVDRAEAVSKQVLGPRAVAAISPGNMDGGLSSIMEKSLGCIVKGGSTAINEVVHYGAYPDEKGLILMDGPGYDAESITGVVAGGAQIVLFTTGRGNPLGYPIVPVVKIASNPKLFEHMEDDMDINAGRILEGKATLEGMGREMVDFVLEVANGRETKAELNRQGSLICPYVSSPCL